MRVHSGPVYIRNKYMSCWRYVIRFFLPSIQSEESDTDQAARLSSDLLRPDRPWLPLPVSRPSVSSRLCQNDLRGPEHALVLNLLLRSLSCWGLLYDSSWPSLTVTHFMVSLLPYLCFQSTSPLSSSIGVILLGLDGVRPISLWAPIGGTLIVLSSGTQGHPVNFCSFPFLWSSFTTRQKRLLVVIARILQFRFLV